jgi:hypothetical protein
VETAQFKSLVREAVPQMLVEKQPWSTGRRVFRGEKAPSSIVFLITLL